MPPAPSLGRPYLAPGKSVTVLESATGLIETRTADATGRQISTFEHPDNRPSMWMAQFTPPKRLLQRISNR